MHTHVFGISATVATVTPALRAASASWLVGLARLSVSRLDAERSSQMYMPMTQPAGHAMDGQGLCT